MITNERPKETYLAHFGIKGQKWGVRRYQNEDGSLTEEGKGRYELEGENSEKNRSSNGFFSKNNMKKQWERSKVIQNAASVPISAALAASGLAVGIKFLTSNDKFLKKVGVAALVGGAIYGAAVPYNIKKYKEHKSKLNELKKQD